MNLETKLARPKKLACKPLAENAKILAEDAQN